MYEIDWKEYKAQIGAILLLLAALVALLALSWQVASHDAVSRPVAKNAEPSLTQSVTIGAVGPRGGIEAESYYVLDINTGESLFERNASAQLPLASLTKIMTASVALSDSVGEEKIVISMEALAADGNSGLFGDEEWEINELVGFMLVSSSNDAAVALSETDELFVKRMNDQAKRLGLHGTYFINPTGLDESSALAGGYGTARDMTYLMADTISKYPATLSLTTKEYVNFNSTQFEHHAVNTNGTVDESLGLIASKTGYTELAGGNLVVVFDVSINRPVAVAVLGSSEDGRFSDVSILAEAAVRKISAGTSVGKGEIRNGG